MTSRRSFMLATAATLAGCAHIPDEPARSGPAAVEVIRRGTGRPTTVLEAGLGNSAADWGTRSGELLPVLAEVSEVFAYSRPGYGRSVKTAAARDPATIAREL